MSDNVKDNLANSDNWLRVLLVLLYVLIFTLAVWVIPALFAFLWRRR